MLNVLSYAHKLVKMPTSTLSLTNHSNFFFNLKNKNNFLSFLESIALWNLVLSRPICKNLLKTNKQTQQQQTQKTVESPALSAGLEFTL